MGKGLQLMFFGHLRALELEHLYERAFYALTESFLVLTVFKDEFKLQFSLFFSILLFLRIFHWIISDRVDLIFQTAQPASWFTHARLTAAILIFDILDILLIRYCVTHILANATGALIMFAFEFVLLKNSMILAAGRYVLNVFEAFYLKVNQDEDNWEAKSFYTFVLEAMCDSTRLLTYVAFFFVILKPYGLPPLHIIRDVYITTVSLFTKVNDFIKARRAKAAMDKEILDATEEDLARDNVCIICREEMSVANPTLHRYVPKKLPCRHVIHYGCLKSWLERSQRCPTCRRPVLSGETPDATATVIVNVDANQVPLNDADGDNNNGNQNNIGNFNNDQDLGIPGLENNNARQPEDVHPPYFVTPPEPLPPSQQQPAASGNDTAPPPQFQPVNIYSLHAGPENAQNDTPPLPTPTQQPSGGNMILQHHIEFPTGLQLPKGWGVLSAKESAGVRQVQLMPGKWALVLPAPSSSSSSTTPPSSSGPRNSEEPSSSIIATSI